MATTNPIDTDAGAMREHLADYAAENGFDGYTSRLEERLAQLTGLTVAAIHENVFADLEALGHGAAEPVDAAPQPQPRSNAMTLTTNPDVLATRTEEIAYHVARAKKANPAADLGARLIEAQAKGYAQPVFDTLTNWAEGAVTHETTTNLWLALERVEANLTVANGACCTLAEAFVVWYAEVAERVTYGYADDTWSGRSNDLRRTAAEATRRWLADNRYLNAALTEG